MYITQKIKDIEKNIYKAIRRDSRKITDNWYMQANERRDGADISDSKEYYRDFIIAACEALGENSKD